jgi:hypothetical protein
MLRNEFIFFYIKKMAASGGDKDSEKKVKEEKTKAEREALHKFSKSKTKQMQEADQRHDRIVREHHAAAIREKFRKQREHEKMLAFHNEARRRQEEILKEKDSNCVTMKVGGFVNDKRPRIGNMK